MKHFLLGAIFATSIILVTRLSEPSHKPTDEMKSACMYYAMMDHEKEFTPRRWEYLKTIGNPNDVEFWYKSCINHHTYPVGAGERNEWVK